MNTNQEASVEVHASGAVSFVGKDAVNLYRAMTLKSALSLYAKTGMLPTRGVSATAMLKMATEYTGKPYKRGEYLKAAEDLDVWIKTMRAAIPTTINGEQQ